MRRAGQARAEARIRLRSFGPLFPLDPAEPTPLPAGRPGGDIAGRQAGFALRHLLLRAAQGVPPGGALRCPRQRVTHDLLDLVEAQRQLVQGLPSEMRAQAS